MRLDAPPTRSRAPARVGRPAYLAIALLIAGIVAWGFWETITRSSRRRTDLPSIVHLHAAVFSAWVLLLVAQAAARRGRPRALHRRARHRRDGLRRVGFLGRGPRQRRCACAARAGGQFPLEVGGMVVLYNLADMLLFGAFLALAFAYRNRPELHKRWIIAATAALGGAAIGRVVQGDTPQYLLRGCRRCSRSSRSISRRAAVCTPCRSSAARCIVVAFFKVPLFVGARVARRRRRAAAAICLISALCSMISSRIWTEGWPATA